MDTIKDQTGSTPDVLMWSPSSPLPSPTRIQTSSVLSDNSLSSPLDRDSPRALWSMTLDNDASCPLYASTMEAPGREERLPSSPDQNEDETVLSWFPQSTPDLLAARFALPVTCCTRQDCLCSQGLELHGVGPKPLPPGYWCVARIPYSAGVLRLGWCVPGCRRLLSTRDLRANLAGLFLFLAGAWDSPNALVESFFQHRVNVGRLLSSDGGRDPELDAHNIASIRREWVDVFGVCFDAPALPLDNSLAGDPSSNIGNP